jgi:K+-transporting ATPase ATPase B chain
MDRLVKANVIAKSGRAVEAAGDVDTLLLDKTGTITFGNRMADAFEPVPGVTEGSWPRRRFARLAGRRDARGQVDRRRWRERAWLACQLPPARSSCPSPRRPGCRAWTSATGASARARSDASCAMWAESRRPSSAGGRIERIARSGGTPLVVADGPRILGVVHLKDVVKPGIRERFAELRAMGIRTVMITGDNPLTAAAIAAEAGVDDFLAEATPEKKLD